jgi:hypothetical protein
MNRNSAAKTIHFIITDAVPDEVITTEKCRDSIGGWTNMIKRIRATFDGAVFQIESTDGPNNCVANMNGRRIRVQQWSKI